MEEDVQKTEEVQVATEPKPEPKPKLAFDYANPLSPVIGFLKKGFGVIADWICGKAEKTPDQTNKDQGEVKELSGAFIENAAYGVLFTLVAIVTLVASYLMNERAVGAVFPDLEPIEIALLWGLMINLSLPIVMASGLTAMVVAIGFLATDDQEIGQLLHRKSEIVNNQDTPERRRRNYYWPILLIMVVVVAGLAAYRTYVYNGYHWNYNCLGIFALTIVAETFMAVATSIGFRLLIGPVLNRIFGWLIRNWPQFRLVVRFVLGLVGFGILAVPLVIVVILYCLIRIPYYLILAVYEIHQWIKRNRKEWDDGKQKRHDDWQKELDQRKKDELAAIQRNEEIRQERERIKKAKQLEKQEKRDAIAAEKMRKRAEKEQARLERQANAPKGW